MAKNTKIDLRNQMIYQVFPRQHSSESNFNGVCKDLDRIKDLGCDILYLLPIHPIGEKNKKGTIGCPYSIKNYREINADLGTEEDFVNLINETHKRGMKLIIDVVYNHTSKDSYLLEKHPEWFYRNKEGEFANRVGDWWDVTDLDYTNHDLWNELIDTLIFWVKKGVDGFRCDVSSLVPIEFWLEARKELEKVNPDIILLSESIHIGFAKYIRDCGFEVSPDYETFEAFDMEYDYDVYPAYEQYLKHNGPLKPWLIALLEQEGRYQKNYVKAHFLENHDCERAAKYVKDPVKLRNLNALIFFLKGIAFVYAGQEACDETLESLFEIDLVDFSTMNKNGMADLIKRCAKIKKDPLFANGIYNIHISDLEIAHITYENDERKIVCIANLGNEKGLYNIESKDGVYVNLINDEEVLVKDGKIELSSDPLVIEVSK